MKINSIIDLVKDLDTSRQTKNLNKLLIRILLHLQVEFSSNGITGYGKTNNAPKLAFVFKTGDAGVSVDRRFVVISGYAKTEGATDGTTDVPAGKGGYLINLNLSTLNNGQGILVDTDPTIPEGVTPEPGGQEDLEDENVNVIVRVQVQAWTAVNVFPIL